MENDFAYIRLGLQAAVHDAEHLEIAVGVRGGGRLGGHGVGLLRMYCHGACEGPEVYDDGCFCRSEKMLG